jgi:hypothetical protein
MNVSRFCLKDQEITSISDDEHHDERLCPQFYLSRAFITVKIKDENLADTEYLGILLISE